MTEWVKGEDGCHCVHCGLTWDMHLCDGFSTCPRTRPAPLAIPFSSKTETQLRFALSDAQQAIETALGWLTSDVDIERAVEILRAARNGPAVETSAEPDWKHRAEEAEGILSDNMALANRTTRRAMDERNGIIRKLRERYSAIEIADMAGLTRQRVHQILNEAPVEGSVHGQQDETPAKPTYTEKDVGAIVAAVDAVRATKAVTPLTLRDFGYAPGNYSCICFACGGEFIADKRAIQCEPCALQKLARSQVKSTVQPTAPAAISLASKVSDSSTDTAAGAVPTCAKHGVELAFEGDECWACKEDES